MDSTFRCPYDGFRMVDTGGEGHLECAFRFYECPNCGHEGVEAIWHKTGETNRRSKVMCKCAGCKRERARTGKILLKE